MEKKYNILLFCEESQAVCIEFRKLGFNAFSADILKCSGSFPEYHIKGDALSLLKERNISFKTEDDKIHKINKWHLCIGFPPCTHLAVSGAAHFEKKIKDGRQQQGIDFFMKLVNAPIKHIAIENPIGIMSSRYKNPDQIIQPYYFGDKAQKSTCLWLKNLPKLYHNDKPNLFDEKVTHVSKGEFYEWTDKKTGKKKKQPLWYYEALINAKSKDEVGHLRSKTFPGIAKAMSKQWGEYLFV